MPTVSDRGHCPSVPPEQRVPVAPLASASPRWLVCYRERY